MKYDYSTTPKRPISDKDTCHLIQDSIHILHKKYRKWPVKIPAKTKYFENKMVIANA